MKGRLAGIAAIVSSALLAAGCGGGGGGGSAGDAASLAPADALAYVTVDTDFSSAQISNAQAILDKFPIKDRLLQLIRNGAAQGGANIDALRSSIGPQLDVAVLKVNGETNAVGFTRPSDEKAFDAQLDKQSTKHTTVDGWTVFADKQAFLDAVTNRAGNLADDATYKAALASIPGAGDAIARVYSSTAGLQTALGAATSSLGSAAGSFGSFGSFGTAKWVAVALTAKDGAVKLEVHAKSGSSAPAGGTLAGEIPSGAIVALQLIGGGATIPANVQQQLSALSQQLGVDLGSLLSALDGPVVAYVRPGLPLPEATIAARPTDPQRAATAVGGLLARLGHGKGVATKVDGGTLNKVDLGPVALYYGVAGGQLVVTDSAGALAELKGSVGRLSDDAVFKEAKDGAGMPDTGQGFLFVDLKDALPAIAGVAQLANQKLPAAVEENLRPLRSVLVYGTRDAGIQTLVAYLKTS